MPTAPTSPRSTVRSVARAGAALLVLTATVATASAVAEPALSPLHRADLTVTEGALSSVPAQAGLRAPVLLTRSAAMRAVHRDAGRHATRATLRFRLRGPSDTIKPLGSGQIRRQIGLKLRAKDPCNLVYVMWRDQPASVIVVSVKRNPGEHTSAECGNRGYTDVATIPAPAGRTGVTHALSARTRRAADGSLALSVFADGSRVRSLRLAAALTGGIEGQAGVRSDNGTYAFTLSVGRTAE